MLNPLGCCAVVVIAVAVSTFGVGCNGSPSTPSRTAAPTSGTTAPPPGGSPSPPRASMAFEMSGRVTDDEGRPVPGARVTVLLDEYSGPSVLTDSAGRYAISFDGVPGAIHFPGRDPAGTESAVAFAQVEAPGYERFARYILGTTQSLVDNVRLHRIARIAAGESLELTIAPDDTVCAIDFWPGRELICGIVRVVAPGNGIMRVEATPGQAGAQVPTVVVYGNNSGSRGNPTSIQVSGGTEYIIQVELPWGDRASQSVLLKTSMSQR